MSELKPVEEKSPFSIEVLIPRPRGCDVWVVKDGREHKLWKAGHDPRDGFPREWAVEVVARLLDGEAAMAAERAEEEAAAEWEAKIIAYLTDHAEDEDVVALLSKAAPAEEIR